MGLPAGRAKKHHKIEHNFATIKSLCFSKHRLKMMRFCKECNNILHPRENKERKRLEFACKPPCPYVERNITESCVFINDLVKDST